MEETSHPVLAVVAFLATLMFGTPNTESAMTGVPPAPLPDLITIDPDPPVAGQDLKICFGFREGDPSPITLELRWSPLVGPVVTDTVNVTAENPCVTVQVPSDAVSYQIIDQSGTSAARGGPVD